MNDRMLVISRISAYCLNTLTQHLGMGTMVHAFQADDPDAWCEASVGCKALIHGRPVALLHMEPLPIHEGDPLPNKVTIYVNDIYAIVRPKNLADFSPHEYGIEPNRGRNWMGDKEDDLVSSITLDEPEEQIPGLFAPRNHLPQNSMGRAPQYNGSLDRRKYH